MAISAKQLSGPRVFRKAVVWQSLRQWAVAALILMLAMAWMPFVRLQSRPNAIRSLPLGLALSAMIGSFAWTLIPAAARISAGWRPASRWALYLFMMVFSAVAGTAAVGTVPFLVGVIPADFIVIFFRDNIAGTIPVTLMVGIAMIAIGTARARLEATE